jgi:hypothetical protein
MRRAIVGGIAWVLALSQAVGVQAAPDHGMGGVVQQRPTPPCSQPAGNGRWAAAGPSSEFEEQDVGPAGSWGRPRLCVVYFATEDVYNLMITGTDNVEQFRAAKAESVSRLQARGFDLCRASKWGSWGAQNQPGYTFDDYYSMTVPCGPQVRAGDPGAAAHLPTVQDALARAADAAAEDLGNRPEAPLSVLVYTDKAAAIDGFKRYRATFETDDRAEAAAVAGVSRSVQGQGTNYIYGTVIQVNLTDPNYVTTAKIDLDVMNRYSFFALNAAAGTDPNVNTGVNSVVPRWFGSGVLTRQAYRRAVGGTNGGYLVEAARAAREGTIPPLASLQTLDQERAASDGFGYYVVTARTYATVAYLYETYGATGVAGLLRENRNGSAARFNDLLGRLVGADAAGLDGAVTNWLLGLTAIRAASADGQFKVEALLYGDGRHGEALVDEAASACLFDVSDANVQVQNAPGIVGLSLAIGPDGSYLVSRPSTRAGNAVSLSGRIEGPGQLSASYQVTNEVTGCDSGAISLGPA